MIARVTRRSAGAWAVTLLCFATAGICGKLGYREWFRYHEVVMRSLRADGSELTLPLPADRSDCDFRLVIRGAVRCRETGALVDAERGFATDGRSWTHAALELMEPNLERTSDYSAPHKIVFASSSELPAPDAIRLRLNPLEVGSDSAFDGVIEPHFDGTLQVELSEYDPHRQEPLAALLWVAGLALGAVGVVRVRAQLPRRRPRLRLGSELDRLLRSVRRNRHEVLALLDELGCPNRATLARSIAALAEAAGEIAANAQTWKDAGRSPLSTSNAAPSLASPAGRAYADHLARLTQIEETLRTLGPRLRSAGGIGMETTTEQLTAVEEELRLLESAPALPDCSHETAPPVVRLTKAG